MLGCDAMRVLITGFGPFPARRSIRARPWSRRSPAGGARPCRGRARHARVRDDLCGRRSRSAGTDGAAAGRRSDVRGCRTHARAAHRDAGAQCRHGAAADASGYRPLHGAIARGAPAALGGVAPFASLLGAARKNTRAARLSARLPAGICAITPIGAHCSTRATVGRAFNSFISRPSAFRSGRGGGPKHRSPSLRRSCAPPSRCSSRWSLQAAVNPARAIAPVPAAVQAGGTLFDAGVSPPVARCPAMTIDRRRLSPRLPRRLGECRITGACRRAGEPQAMPQALPIRDAAPRARIDSASLWLRRTPPKTSRKPFSRPSTAPRPPAACCNSFPDSIAPVRCDWPPHAAIAGIPGATRIVMAEGRR